jgi:hypothetical protein
MTKSKTQKQLVSKFLTQEQLQKLPMYQEPGYVDYFELSTKPELGYKPNGNIEVFETTTGGDDVWFSVKITEDYIIIKVGGYVTYSETKITNLGSTKIDKFQLKVIKTLIKDFTTTIGNSIQPDWK